MRFVSKTAFQSRFVDVLGLLAKRPARGVDQNVDPAEFLQHVVAQALDGRTLGDIHLVAQRLPSGLLDRSAHFLGQFLASAGGDDVCAGFGQRDCDRASQT